MAVEDSPVGIESARAAGLRIVAIAGLGGELGMQAFDSLASVTVQDLLDA